jgi:hypothetical protein
MRNLRLRKETLAELSTAELTSVVGGISGATCPVKQCLTNNSDFQECITGLCITNPCTGTTSTF